CLSILFVIPGRRSCPPVPTVGPNANLAGAFLILSPAFLCSFVCRLVAAMVLRTGGVQAALSPQVAVDNECAEGSVTLPRPAFPNLCHRHTSLSRVAAPLGPTCQLLAIFAQPSGVISAPAAWLVSC